jgi:RalA-binding protein 1
MSAAVVVANDSAPAPSSTALPRNSSIDSAISNVSSRTPPQHAPQDSGYGASDIESMIRRAGSPEAVIQALLKEKNSLAQQHSQLWRLVDKQRAMILGLNKDLERALKDKEKYRTKLKDALANSNAPQGPSSREDPKDSRKAPGHQITPIDVKVGERAKLGPDSPMLDSPGVKQSPIEGVLAPYPITPPADHSAGVVRVAAPPESPQLMPNPQEHAHNKYDHEAEEKAQDKARIEKGEEQLKDIHFLTSLPPSRALPPDPPKVPPPKPPQAKPPSLSLVEASPRPDNGLASFPSPPRKGPPAPLQLNSPIRDSAIDEDTDSDLDDILKVAEIGTQNRGRRRTRAEDDRDREVRAFKEAEARSASKKSKPSQPDAPTAAMPASPRVIPLSTQHAQAGTASLAAVLQGDERKDLAPPLMSPGLPSSPRPMNMSLPLHSPPLSPRGAGSFPAAQLSPRPPRQPIPLPPNTPLATPAVSGSDGTSKTSKRPAKNQPAPGDSGEPGQANTAERTRIYKGLVTEEYPDLLLPPNALPSISLNVASSRMKPSRASLISLTQLEEDPVFTLAVISRADSGELWRVEKDSASLSKLDARLKQCQSFTARTPDKALFSGHAPAKVDARRTALEQYLDELLNTPLDVATAVELCKYLSTNTLPPNADEMGSSGGAQEGSSHMIGPDGRPIRSGYLTKRGKNFGGWKSRFFLLDGPLLKYYETPGGAHLGTIKLQNAQIGKQSHHHDSQSPTRAANGEEPENQYRHAFLILEPKRKDSNSHVKHVLCAENDGERDLWVDALLQWIDYRGPNDEDAPPTSKSSSHAQSSSKGRKSNQSSSKPGHHAADSDPLVSVRYDATQAGDAPHSGKSKGASGSGDHGNHNDTLTSQTSKLISGPKDPQPISDTAAWGNKPGLAVPSYEEKKARKRSFFGFGPKTRSNSDGQESITPAADAFGSTPPQPQYTGPVRQVFGAPLAEAVRYCSPWDIRVPLPAVVYRCIQYLDSKGAVTEEGIFRLSGSNLVIKQLRERFNTEGDINLTTDENYYDIHAVASLLKLYLRELPTTILTRDLHMEFLAATEMTDRREKMAALNELAQRLPLPNATLLKYLISFLIKIINNADMNKMTVRNVGIVFSPTLNIPAPVFALFLQNYEPIFGIAPEKYELPTMNAEAESTTARNDSPLHFEAPPQRPSTSGKGASPQRQPRLDSMRDYQRSTPTPPLISGLNPARGSPTPSQSATRQGYEPTYQQAPQTHAQHGYAPRPAYENGCNVVSHPEGYNGHGPHRGAPGHAQKASHDESGGSLQVQDTSHGNRRRESAMFMGNLMGLQAQGSKSRLRDEVRDEFPY